MLKNVVETVCNDKVAICNTQPTTISCLVIVRNMVRTIETCLRTLIQEGVDEIVVVDGQSSDGTSEVVNRFPVIHLYDEGRGVPAARNIGLNACTGKYILIVDADQWIPKQFVQELKALLSDDVYDVVECREEWVGSSIWAKAQQASWIQVESLRESWIYWPRLMRKSFICAAGGWDESFKGFEDLDLWNRIKRLNPKVCKASLVVYSDARDISPTVAFKRGIYSHVSMPLYLCRYPSQWQKVLSVAPMGFAIDFALALRILLINKNVRIALASLVMRVSMSAGRFVGVCFHQVTRNVARIPREISTQVYGNRTVGHAIPFTDLDARATSVQY